MFSTFTRVTAVASRRRYFTSDRHICMSVSNLMSNKKNKHAKNTKQVAPSPSAAGPIQEKSDSVVIQFLVKPGAKSNSITDIGEDAVGIQVAAPPVDGEANAELVKFVSKLLGVRKSDVQLDKGSRSRNKTVVVSGLDKAAIVKKFEDEIG